MLASLLLSSILFVTSGTVLGIIATKTDSEGIGIISTLFCLCSFVALLILLLGGGISGLFGYNTYKEFPTENFSKALLSDHSAVVIKYPNDDSGKAYTFSQFNIVHNYYTITNILICERRSVFGNQTEFNIKIVTPTYREE